MKFSQVLLDLETGDASMHDVHVKEAEGKINVSSAIFEYASRLAEMSENSSFIQEAAAAAADAGLPTSPSEGAGLATEAVAQELIGFYDVVIENAKKVKAAADRNMKAIIGLGKKYGIAASAAQSGNFESGFAKPLAQAIISDKSNSKGKGSIKLPQSIFPKASESEKLIHSYGTAMVRLAAVFGLSIGECVEDPTVKNAISVAGLEKAQISDVNDLYKALLKGSSVPKASKVSTTGKIDADDIAELITYTYVAFQVSKCVVAAASSKKKSGATAFIKQLCADEEGRHSQTGKIGQKKISRKFDKINENVKVWASDVSTTADGIVKSFSDAVSVLGSLATGSMEDVVKEGYSFFEEAHHRKSNVGSLIGSLFPGLGSLIGYFVGRHIWRNNAAEELAGFVEDLSKVINEGGFKKVTWGKRIDRVIEGCDVCLHESARFTPEQIKKIKKLLGDTKALRTQDMGELRHWFDVALGGEFTSSLFPIHGVPKPCQNAINEWIESAQDCIQSLQSKGSE